MKLFIAFPMIHTLKLTHDYALGKSGEKTNYDQNIPNSFVTMSELFQALNRCKSIFEINANLITTLMETEQGECLLKFQLPK